LIAVRCCIAVLFRYEKIAQEGEPKTEMVRRFSDSAAPLTAG